MKNFYRKNQFKKIFNRIVYGSFYRADSKAERKKMKRRYRKKEQERKGWFERKKRENSRIHPKNKNVSKKEIVENSTLSQEEVDDLLD